jgi:hypothetical protein
MGKGKTPRLEVNSFGNADRGDTGGQTPHREPFKEEREGFLSRRRQLGTTNEGKEGTREHFGTRITGSGTGYTTAEHTPPMSWSTGDATGGAITLSSATVRRSNGKLAGVRFIARHHACNKEINHKKTCFKGDSAAAPFSTLNLGQVPGSHAPTGSENP